MTRFPLLTSALAIAAVYSVGNLVIVWASGPADPALLVEAAVLGVILEALMFWLILTVMAGREARRRSMHVASSAPLSGAGPGHVPPPFFLWEGWNLRAGFVAGGLLLLAVGVLVVAVRTPEPRTAVVLEEMTTALATGILGGVVLQAAARRRRFLVDRRGIRIERGLRTLVSVTWSGLSEIGFAKSGIFLWAGDQVLEDAQALLLFRDRDGRLVGRIAPAATMSWGAAQRFVAAVVAQAKAAGVPIRSLTYREWRAWRRSRAAGGMQHAP